MGELYYGAAYWGVNCEPVQLWTDGEYTVTWLPSAAMENSAEMEKKKRCCLSLRAKHIPVQLKKRESDACRIPALKGVTIHSYFLFSILNTPALSGVKICPKSSPVAGYHCLKFVLYKRTTLMNPVLRSFCFNSGRDNGTQPMLRWRRLLLRSQSAVCSCVGSPLQQRCRGFL